MAPRGRGVDYGATMRVENAREMRRFFRTIEKGLGKELRDELRTRVAEPVAARIRAIVPAPSGWWRDRIKAHATQTSAYITWGRASVPYAAPVEFGGWPRGRPFVAEGRYVWPTAKQKDPALEQAAVDAYEAVLAKADRTPGI